MKSLCVAVILLLTSLSLPQRTPSDDEQIKATIRDYIEGYYKGDATRVARALHPKLAKRHIRRTKEGAESLGEGSAEEMVKLTAEQDGPKSYKAGQQRLEIKIFEIQGKTATAKALAQDWVDYIHLAKIEGKWVIVNVLWTMAPPPK